MASDGITIFHRNRRVVAELSMFRKRSISVILDRAHHVKRKWFVQPTFNCKSLHVFHSRRSRHVCVVVKLCGDARVWSVFQARSCCLFSCSICICLASSLRPRPNFPPPIIIIIINILINVRFVVIITHNIVGWPSERK